MKTMITTTAVGIILIVVSASIFLSAPWFRRIHSVSIYGSSIMVETSPDGRLANPDRTTFEVPMWVAGATVLVGIAILAIVVGGFWSVLFNRSDSSIHPAVESEKNHNF